MLLVVEDNGVEGEKDELTWGIYQLPPTGWIPTDAETGGRQGCEPDLVATDFERRDDVGIQMPPNKLVQCKSFPVAAYDFPEIKYAGGDLQVQHAVSNTDLHGSVTRISRIAICEIRVLLLLADREQAGRRTDVHHSV